MQNGTTAPTPVDTYKGMRISGVFTAAACGLLLFGVLSTAVTAGKRIDVSVPISLGVGCLVGSMLVLAGMILHGVSKLFAKLEEHKADHEQAVLAVEDVERINLRLDSLDRHTAETHELLAHTSVCQAAPVKQEASPEERRAYANGAVDVLDGHAAVVPMSGGPGLRIVPVQDPRRHA
jgi:hypothetical protein